MDLTDAKRAVLELTFRPRRRPDGRGRPWIGPRAPESGALSASDRRSVARLCRRGIRPIGPVIRFQPRQRSGRLDRLVQRLAEDLRDRGKIDLCEAFVAATLASTKRGTLTSFQHAVA